MDIINWEEIKAVYVTTDQSTTKLAEKYRVSLSALQKKCRLDGWVAARMAFRAQAAAKAVDQAVDVEADRLGKIINAANSMATVIEAMYGDPQQFHRHIVTDTMIDEDGGKAIMTVERQFDKVDTRAIKDMTGALKDMTLVLRNLHNLPTQAEAEAQRIAAERLKLEQRKVDAAEKAGEVDKSIVVKLEGDLEAFAK